MFGAYGVGGGEQGEEVCELAEGAGESVVGCVVRGAGDGVAAQDGGGAMRGVGFVGCEVDFAEESGGWVSSFLLGGGLWDWRGAHFCSWCLSLRTILGELMEVCRVGAVVGDFVIGRSFLVGLRF